jgi:hypothetical protein
MNTTDNHETVPKKITQRNLNPITVMLINTDRMNSEMLLPSDAFR